MIDVDDPSAPKGAPRPSGLEVGDEGAGAASRGCFIAHLEWRVRLLEATAADPATPLIPLRVSGRWREATLPTGHETDEW